MVIGILGGYQTDFARNWTKEGGDFAAMFGEVVAGTLEAAQVDAADVELSMSAMLGQLFTGQGHLGAMPATVNPRLPGNRPLGTRQRVRPAASRCSPPWPISSRGATTSRCPRRRA